MKETLIFVLTICLVLFILFVKGLWDDRKQRRYFKRKLYEEYGKIPERTYKPERFARIDSYFNAHPKVGQLDDITWNDLNMDALFQRMNMTLSAAGEEYLYYLLRTPGTSEEQLTDLEEIVSYFADHEDERVKIQLLMRELGGTGNYSLYDYLEHLDTLEKRNNTRIILTDLLLLVSLIVCGSYMTQGLLLVCGLAIYQIITYFKTKKEIEPYVISFVYVQRLLRVCDKLVKQPVSVCRKEWEEIKAASAKLSKLKKSAYWILSGSGKLTGSGNPLEILMDYVNMVFHIDIMMFHRMLDALNQHREEVDHLVGQVGRLDAAISIGSFRESLANGWCKPRFVTPDSPALSLQEGYHPLLEAPVKNSIQAVKGVLVTGSNASGKSTFLKTVAVNAVMAQTIYTCAADSYCAPFFRICSSMALRDDMETGESYYIVEINALKRILESTGEVPVLCFVDEVLRGTNTVERIAASTQILKSLSGKQFLCFAATHDVELTGLLNEYYHNYHFTEELIDGAMYFSYELLEGKALTRNAIRLLEIIGYEKDLILAANRMAEQFEETGVWNI